MLELEVSFVPSEGAKSESLAVSTTSAQSTTLYNSSPGYVNIFSTVDCFVRMGANPVAVNTGADQFIPANNLLRTGPIPVGFKLAFITPAGTGTVYITKES